MVVMPYLVIMTVSTRIFLILNQLQVCFTFSANHEFCLGADLPSDITPASTCHHYALSPLDPKLKAADCFP